jgi:deoxyhypusine synthase
MEGLGTTNVSYATMGLGTSTAQTGAEFIGSVGTGSMPEHMKKGEVHGYDFQKGPVDFEALLNAYKYSGFQATNFGYAIEEINKMIKWRLSDEPVLPDESEQYLDPEVRKNTRCTIFLGFTSNMISCGCREIIRYLAQNKMIDCIVTTAGGIEEDFMKCFKPHYLGDFALNGPFLRKQGLNRLGNLIVPSENYTDFELWVTPIIEAMHQEQKEKGKFFSPSKIIKRLGKEMNDESSVYYWCAKNKIPVFCPAITDGSLGDMLYFHSYKEAGFIVDINQDIRKLNSLAVWAKKSGQIILGGGVIKHHICNANLMRNGADYSLFINTGQEFDGSDSGARPDEAISWGKIKIDANPVKLYAECSLVFPLLVAMTFAKTWQPRLDLSK